MVIPEMPSSFSSSDATCGGHSIRLSYAAIKCRSGVGLLTTRQSRASQAISLATAALLRGFPQPCDEFAALSRGVSKCGQPGAAALRDKDPSTGSTGAATPHAEDLGYS